MNDPGANLKVAIAGAGRMGRERARAATTLGARVAAVCDPDGDRARALADELGAAVVADVRDLRWSALDALFVCTPPGARGEAELAAVRASVPLFVEKPIGLTAEHSLPVLRALRERPVPNAVGYMNRYRPSTLRARELLAASRPLAAVFHWLGTPYRVPWWLLPGGSGGPLNEQGTHLVDLVRYLLGDVVEVQATARDLAGGDGIEGAVAMTLRTSEGLLVAGIYACEAQQKQIAFEAFQAGGSVRLEGWDLRLAGAPGLDAIAPHQVFDDEVAAFFGSLRSGDASGIRCSFEEAVRTQLAMDALRRSLRTGRRERVEAPPS